MFQKVYLPPHRQAQKTVQKKPGNKNAGAAIEKESPRKSSRERQTAAKENTNIRQNTAEKNGEENVLNRLKEIAPGTYQFLRPGQKKHEQAPGLILSPEATGCGDVAEQRFRRVDGLAGPYQYHNTPVYQFT